MFLLWLALALGLAACAPAPEVIVLAPTETLAGPVVPTRAPVSTATARATVTEAPTSVPAVETSTDTPTVAPTTAVPVSSETPSPTTAPTDIPATATATPEPPTTVPTNTAVIPTTPPTSEPITAQGNLAAAVLNAEPAGTLSAGSVETSQIGDLNPWMTYAIAADTGAVLDFKLETTNGGLRPLLMVVDANGLELARSLPPVQGGQALIRGVPLAGGERLIVTRFNGRDGRTRGAFELTVSAGDAAVRVGTFAGPVTYDGLASGMINSSRAEQVFSFMGTAGDLITIQAAALSGDLDTWLELADISGTLLARNDDDLHGGTRDSAVYSFPLPADGPYTISVSRFSGSESEGDFRLKLTLEGLAANDGLINARLDLFNSVSFAEGSTVISDFRAGDIILDDAEVRTQTLLTFHLPPLPAETVPEGAHLMLNTCTEEGAGFAGLGEMSIYAEQFGELSVRRDYTRPTAGARIIATIDSCTLVDVTETVAAAYASGAAVVQFRLSFPAIVANQVTDEVRFDPRLIISPAG